MGHVIQVTHHGDLSRTEKWLTKLRSKNYLKLLQLYGEKGVRALQEATPKKTGSTAAGWYYEIAETKSGITVQWKNSYAPYGVCVAILIQYGHATGNGGYVQGTDYINPALKPVFDALAKDAWEAVIT